MSMTENQIHKTHASGSWRVIRSMAVPANVTPFPSNERTTTHQTSTRKIQKVEEESVRLEPRKTPGYFEHSDPSFSNS